MTPRSTSALAVLVSLGVGCLAGTAHAQIGSTESYLGQNGTIGFTVVGTQGPNCNEVVFAAIPGDSGHVLGRYNNNCTGANPSHPFSLARFAIDWTADTLTFTNMVLDPSQGDIAIAENASVAYALEPSVMSYSGELWVSFECGGDIPTSTTNSACAGPMSSTTWTIDPTRTTVPIVGNDSLGDGTSFSGSVPKLLSFGGNAYLYWSAVHIDASGNWLAITERGNQLSEDGFGLLVSAGANPQVGAGDPNNTTEVWGLGTSPGDDQVADVQGIFAIGDMVFATAAVAGSACNDAFNPLTCYTLSISKSASPLGADIFNAGTSLPMGELPSNTQSYTRYFQDPLGNPYLMGVQFANAPGPQPLPSSPPMQAFSIPADATYFYGCTPSCSGTVLTNGFCVSGDCADFGSTCVDDNLGARCVFYACPAQGSATVCLPSGELGTCANGAVSSQSCGPGTSCVSANGAAACAPPDAASSLSSSTSGSSASSSSTAATDAVSSSGGIGSASSGGDVDTATSSSGGESSSGTLSGGRTAGTTGGATTGRGTSSGSTGRGSGSSGEVSGATSVGATSTGGARPPAPDAGPPDHASEAQGCTCASASAAGISGWALWLLVMAAAHRPRSDERP